MPSFLNKVFGRKKSDEKDGASHFPGRPSDASLLDGKFEAVSPTVSPTAVKFPELAYGKTNGNGKEKEKEGAFGLFKTKSRTSTVEPPQKRVDLPQLSLNLPGPKEESSSRALGVVFEADPDAQILLTDSDIGSRRLNPLEALILVRACSQAITSRGLETLGIMHPHWYSASPEVQRRLISLFIQSLAPKSQITTLSPTASARVSAFESEINFTRSPHDVAAVLRWGLRHLQLESASFGKDASWYQSFFDSEKASNYPHKAYSEQLIPQLPPAHLELLTATLEIISSLAAHAEANSISGSKLSKFLGLWLLNSQRADGRDDWPTFYARWERNGRILEHLFLSRIRDEAANNRMPMRLLEMVQHYPYNKGTPIDTDLLPRPRFSTRRYEALFVRIENDLPRQHKQHPLRLISEALRAEPTANISAEPEEAAAWDRIRKGGGSGSSPTGNLSDILSDETIRFLSLIPIETGDQEPLSPTFSLFVSPYSPTGASRRRSLSLADKGKGTDSTKPSGFEVIQNHGKASSDSKALSTTQSSAPTDWLEFSTSGFFESSPALTPLAATLLDKDVEVTVPRKSSSKRKPVPTSPFTRKSSDAVPTSTSLTSGAFASGGGSGINSGTNSKGNGGDLSLSSSKSRTTAISTVQLDEAFVDFWSDALLDPISSTWPSFVVCKLKKPMEGLDGADRKVEWLVVEQRRPAGSLPASGSGNAAFTSATTATSVGGGVATTSSDGHATSSAEGAGGRTVGVGLRRPRASSPKPSFGSELSASTRKRFSFFSGSMSSSKSKSKSKATSPSAGNADGNTKGGRSKALKVGEMGEILAEEEEKPTTPTKSKMPTVVVRVPSPKPRKSSVEITVGGKKSLDSGRRLSGELEVTEGGKVGGGGLDAVVAAAAGISVAATAVVITEKDVSKDETPQQPQEKRTSFSAPVVEEQPVIEAVIVEHQTPVLEELHTTVEEPVIEQAATTLPVTEARAEEEEEEIIPEPIVEAPGAEDETALTESADVSIVVEGTAPQPRTPDDSPIVAQAARLPEVDSVVEDVRGEEAAVEANVEETIVEQPFVEESIVVEPTAEEVVVGQPVVEESADEDEAVLTEPVIEASAEIDAAEKDVDVPKPEGNGTTPHDLISDELPIKQSESS